MPCKEFRHFPVQKEVDAIVRYDRKEICPAINLVSDVIRHAISLIEFVARNPCLPALWVADSAGYAIVFVGRNPRLLRTPPIMALI